MTERVRHNHNDGYRRSRNRSPGGGRKACAAFSPLPARLLRLSRERRARSEPRLFKRAAPRDWKATQDPLAPRGTNGEWASTEKQKNELVEDHYWTHRFVSLSRTRQGTTARDSCESDRSALSAATANTRSPSESLRTGTSSASLERQTVSKRVRRGEEYESNGDLCRTRELTLFLLPPSPLSRGYDHRTSSPAERQRTTTQTSPSSHPSDSGGGRGGERGTGRAGTKDGGESSHGRGWDDDTSTVLSTA